MKSSKPLSLLTALATAVLVLSGSIAVPILCRPFYYAHIEAMSMPEYTGLTVDQIKQAFDEMLDFSEYETGEVIDVFDGKPIVRTVDGSLLIDEYECERALAGGDLLN